MATSPQPTSETALDYALAYARLGWRVLPIKPGTKRPDLDAWTDVATNAVDIVTSWWGGLYRDHGVGILCGWVGDRCLFALDVDGESHGYDPDASLDELQAQIGDLPDTVEAQTGGGGRHLFYWAPTAIGNGAAVHLRPFGPGLDIRGVGGQVLASPTIHPETGRRYEWVIGSEPWARDVADAPAALLELLVQPDPRQRPDGDRWETVHTGDRPGDRMAADTSWHQLLEADGATYSHTDQAGVDYYTRPGKDVRAGASASVGYGGSDVLKVFTSAWPGLTQDETYTKFGYYAAIHHHGDHQAASSELARQYPAADVVATVAEAEAAAAPEPLRIRWADTYRSDPPPAPEPFVDGLIHRGEFTVIGAERGIGKTWLGYNLATLLTRGEGALFGRLDVIAPRRVLYLQGELDESQAHQRWETMCFGDEIPHVAEVFDRARIRVVRRRSSVRADGDTYTDEFIDAHIDGALTATIEAVEPDVVVLDPWAVYFGGNENSNDEVEAALGRLREFTLGSGVTWVILHHMGKSRDYAEPEDLWRGASRLADWAANRVTIMRHYTEKQAEEKGLSRREARRIVDVKFLRRGLPLDDLSAQLDVTGWWVPWAEEEPDELDQKAPNAKLSPRDVYLKLLGTGGEWKSDKAAADATGMSQRGVTSALLELQGAGLVERSSGVGNATVTRAIDLDRPREPKTGFARPLENTGVSRTPREPAQVRETPREHWSLAPREPSPPTGVAKVREGDPEGALHPAEDEASDTPIVAPSDDLEPAWL